MSYTPIERVSDPAAQREFRRIAESLNSIAVGRIVVLHVAPSKPYDGQVVICDGVHWNPLNDGLKRPIWFDAEANLWKPFA